MKKRLHWITALVLMGSPVFLWAGVPDNGVPGNGVPENGVNSNGVNTNGLPNNGVPNNGVPENGVSNDNGGAGGPITASGNVNLTASTSSSNKGEGSKEDGGGGTGGGKKGKKGKLVGVSKYNNVKLNRGVAANKGLANWGNGNSGGVTGKASLTDKNPMMGANGFQKNGTGGPGGTNNLPPGQK